MADTEKILTAADKGALRAALAHPLENRPWREWLTAVLNSHEALEEIVADLAGERNWYRNQADYHIGRANRAEQALGRARDEMSRLSPVSEET